MGRAQLAAVDEARTRRERLHRLGSRNVRSFTEAIDMLSESYVLLVTGMFSLATASSVPMALLRRIGTLDEHSAGHRTPGSMLYDDLSNLRSELGNVAQPFAGEDERVWNSFLDKWGHRGIFESDIARPRYRQDPLPLLALLRVDALPQLTTDAAGTLGDPLPARRRTPLRPREHDGGSRRSMRGWFSWPIWLQARRVVTAREELCDDAMQVFAACRSHLVSLAATVDIIAEDLWLLHADEVRSLDHGWTPDATKLDDRRQQRSRLEQLTPPDLIQSFDDPSGWADQPADGSIILREIGLPAVTNVAGAWTGLETGDAVRVNATSGVVERV